MKSSRVLMAILGLAGPAAAPLAANVTLGVLFRDGAVLQRDKPVPVWGKADRGEPIAVTFHGQTQRTVTDSDGRWRVNLDPMPATGIGSDLVIAGNAPFVVHDVIVGDVWLCSGQSNMEMVLNDPAFVTFRVDHAADEVAAANDPLIREINIDRQEGPRAPDIEVESWRACTPKNAALFSAVGYFFAREIRRKVGVPVGIVCSSWGGTPVEAWAPPEVLSDPAFAPARQRWLEALEDYPRTKLAFDAYQAAKDGAEGGEPQSIAYLKSHHPVRNSRAVGIGWTPGALFTGMIDPLVPYALKGILWYQGESNADHPEEYRGMFAAMIKGWRDHFGQGDLPFYWVQLADFNAGNGQARNWAVLRDGQTRTLELPATGQAVAIDIGLPAQIHPTNKQEVGRRLALIAEANVYGLQVHWEGPAFADAVREGGGMCVRFKTVVGGLRSAGGPPHSFELAGPDRKFHPADARIDGDTVVVQSAEVPEPVAVRYAWRNEPGANLSDGEHLPVVPFRSDDWPVGKALTAGGVR